MKIIILGAGRVGSALVNNLLREENDITVVDIDATCLQALQDRYDIRTIVGEASHPNVLRQAGGEHADMLIAVTSCDEINMIACQVAFTLFQTPTKIARIRTTAFSDSDTLFSHKSIPVDVCISPEQLITNYIQRLIQSPGALQVLDFANGRLQMVAVQPYYGGPMVGKTMSELYDYISEVQMRVVAIFRRNRSIPVSRNTMLEVGDEIFFVAKPTYIHKILTAFGCSDNPYQRIKIAGGGHIGMRLATVLENDYQVQIIDHNVQTTKMLAEHLNKTTVLQGNASDRDLLLQENIEHTDVFIAVTNDDEANIMACLQAKRLGARHVMALINHLDYVDLIEDSGIDVVISPQQVTTSCILTYLRHGDISNVYSLRRGAAEAIEVIVHGDEKTSKVVGREIQNINLPPGASIGAIVREDEVVIPTRESTIQANDHIILFVQDKKYIHDVERLFHVHVSFFG